MTTILAGVDLEDGRIGAGRRVLRCPGGQMLGSKAELRVIRGTLADRFDSGGPRRGRARRRGPARWAPVANGGCTSSGLVSRSCSRISRPKMSDGQMQLGAAAHWWRYIASRMPRSSLRTVPARQAGRRGDAIELLEPDEAAVEIEAVDRTQLQGADRIVHPLAVIDVRQRDVQHDRDRREQPSAWRIRRASSAESDLPGRVRCRLAASSSNPPPRFGRPLPALVGIENDLHSRGGGGDRAAPADDVVLKRALELDAIVAGCGKASGERVDFVERAMARPGADANSRLHLAAQQIDERQIRAAWRRRPKSAHSKPSYSRQ